MTGHTPWDEVHERVMSGKPCIPGTRITIAGIQAIHRNRALNAEHIAALYPDLSAEDVRQALDVHL